MLEPNSRYYKTGTAQVTVVGQDGESREITFLQRRMIPSRAGTTTLVEHTVKQGERLDNITARYLGDPTQFWRVCDANEVLAPDELTAIPGRVIAIAMPQL